MKISFWTLGDPAVSWTNEQYPREAAARGYDGVDLRVGLRPGQPASGANLLLNSSRYEIEHTRTSFVEADVEISSVNCYNESPRSADATSWSDYEGQLAGYATLTDALGSSRMRVVIGPAPADMGWYAYLHSTWESIGRTLDAHPGLNVVVQNHPGWASARQLFETAEDVDDSRIGLELSLAHSLVMQENLLGLIAEYTRHIHQVCFSDRRLVKEGLADFDGRYYTVRYESCWNGDGVVPAARIFQLLGEGGFDDYVSLEYEKSPSYGLHLPPAVDAVDHFPVFLEQFGIRTAS